MTSARVDLTCGAGALALAGAGVAAGKLIFAAIVGVFALVWLLRGLLTG